MSELNEDAELAQKLQTKGNKEATARIKKQHVQGKQAVQAAKAAQASPTFRRWDIVPDRGSYATLQLIDINEQRGEPVVVGRLSEKYVQAGKTLQCIADSTKKVGSKHCKLFVKDGMCWLNDTSTNGTWIRNFPSRDFMKVVVKEPVRLHHNDQICLMSREYALRPHGHRVPILTVCRCE